jgi:hypothetical protein
MVGVNTGITLKIIDTTFSSSYHNPPVSFNIDVDNDNIADLSLVSIVTGSPGQGVIPYSEFRCLHSQAEIVGFDTIKYNYYTSDTSHSGTPPSVNTYITNLYSCFWLNNNSTLLSTPTLFKYSIKDFGDSIHANEYSLCDTLELARTQNSFYPSYYTSNDTNYTVTLSINNTCNNFPNSQTRFLVFKLRKSTGDKFGWIKLVITSNYIINVKEVALEN